MVAPGIYSAETFSTSAELNAMKFDSRQVLNINNLVCIFRADWKAKLRASASDWLKHF